MNFEPTGSKPLPGALAHLWLTVRKFWFGLLLLVALLLAVSHFAEIEHFVLLME